MITGLHGIDQLFVRGRALRCLRRTGGAATSERPAGTCRRNDT